MARKAVAFARWVQHFLDRSSTGRATCNFSALYTTGHMFSFLFLSPPAFRRPLLVCLSPPGPSKRKLRRRAATMPWSSPWCWSSGSSTRWTLRRAPELAHRPGRGGGKKTPSKSEAMASTRPLGGNDVQKLAGRFQVSSKPPANALGVFGASAGK